LQAQKMKMDMMTMKRRMMMMKVKTEQIFSRKVLYLKMVTLVMI
jgi:hypothetical protein